MWNGPEEDPPVITVFSAPNYCGTHDNFGAVIVSAGTTIDIKTFTEKENQPFLLPEYPLMNAFEFFNDDVTGYVYDFLYHMCKTAIDCLDDDISQSLNASTSTNAQYIQKLIQLNQERTVSMAAIEE